MQIYNLRRRSVLVVLSVAGKSGSAKLVMNGISEELDGPPFMLDSSGQPINMKVKGEIIITDPGGALADNVVCVGLDNVVSKSWCDKDGVRYEIRAHDFAYQHAK